MSSEIYYDRAFIRVDDRYIPIVKHGSSNCFEFEFGREVPENQWSVLNYGFRGQLLFTEDEIRQIAARYEEYNIDNRGGVRKSRNRSFEVGEFGRWIEGGMKTAYTVEEYTACRNTVIVVEHTEPVWKKHVVQTTEELLDKLRELDGKSISVSYGRFLLCFSEGGESDVLIAVIIIVTTNRYFIHSMPSWHVAYIAVKHAVKRYVFFLLWWHAKRRHGNGPQTGLSRTG